MHVVEQSKGDWDSLCLLAWHAVFCLRIQHTHVGWEPTPSPPPPPLDAVSVRLSVTMFLPPLPGAGFVTQVTLSKCFPPEIEILSTIMQRFTMMAGIGWSQREQLGEIVSLSLSPRSLFLVILSLVLHLLLWSFELLHRLLVNSILV